MKNQYVGDVNDFLKYGILRTVQRSRPRQPLFVAWMLTPDDAGPDGMKLEYLQDPAYERVDSELFRTMKMIVASGERNVSAVEASGILGKTEYFSEMVPSNSLRDSYGAWMAAACPKNALVFFDPDNGIEIGKRSAKHLEWKELELVSDSRNPFVIYQHNLRPKGGLDAHFEKLRAKAQSICPGSQVLVLRGPHAGFIVGAPIKEAAEISLGLERFAAKWPRNLRLS